MKFRKIPPRIVDTHLNKCKKNNKSHLLYDFFTYLLHNPPPPQTPLQRKIYDVIDPGPSISCCVTLSCDERLRALSVPSYCTQHGQGYF